MRWLLYLADWVENILHLAWKVYRLVYIFKHAYSTNIQYFKDEVLNLGFVGYWPGRTCVGDSPCELRTCWDNLAAETGGEGKPSGQSPPYLSEAHIVSPSFPRTNNCLL